MIGNLHPAILLLLGGLLVPFLQGRVRQVFCVAMPALGLVHLMGVQPTETGLDFLGYHLDPMRVDKLSLLFGYLFHIAAVIAAIYSLHVKNWVALSTGMLYAGSAVGTVFAGDLITLFVFWELLAVTSVFQIWVRKSKRSGGAGLRYLLMHIASGLLLLAGAAMHFHAAGSLAFEAMTLDNPGAVLIFLAFGVKCAFPFLHTWLVDSYPEATPTGALYLCCFTTKAAVYCMARGFPGADPLIVIGAAMAMFPIFFAVIENDLRRVLGYSMINQIGFMLVGIGIGTPLALNGAVAHAFNDVLFKGLLFMSMGAVLYRTGKINGSELGGLYKSMPWTTGFCIVGAASISAFPLFSGFVSKSMVMSAAGLEGHVVVWLMLLFAAAGVFHHAGIKIPFFAFFAHDSGIRTKEAPKHMLVAMGISATLCIGIGCFPQALYRLLPWDAEYHPYTLTHVVSQTQLLFYSALAFTLLMLAKIYPPELRSTNLDVDWFYRKGARVFYVGADKLLNGLNARAHALFIEGWAAKLSRFFKTAPARIGVAFMTPIWKLRGHDDEALTDRQRDFFERSQLGAFPVGATAFLAVAVMALLFLL
jgi:multicomponent Na+:H+ antiporter subunit D